MDNKLNTLLKLYSEKAKQTPQFGEDFIKYVKYLALKNCPDDKTADLNRIFEHGNIHDFMLFSVDLIPEFDQKVINYIKNY
jgi:hypothetical protein